uniref:Hint domain-containing protein n=1 Tax=Rhizophagus irregularis (strain DAOM 181602 / DAOM 197198 / MUCL 43194) TaxID=747089 RepID=U9UN20_RHIID
MAREGFHDDSELRQWKETRENTKKKFKQLRAKAGSDAAVNMELGEACFAADSKVTLQNGKVTNISELVIGDYVCCGFENGKKIFSEVFLFIHADHDTVTEFQLIDFMKQDGSQDFFTLIDLIYKGTLCVTPEHHIFVNGGGTDFAKNVIPNKTQLFISNGEKLVPVTSARISKERRKGYYSPLTRSGNILVDEVLCSCYASAPPYQALFNFVFAPLKIYTKIFPSNYLDKEIHPYVKFLSRGRRIVEFLDDLNISRSI